jgi:glucose/arabinose dehydrogenase
MLRRRTFLAAAAAGSTLPLVAGGAEAVTIGKTMARDLVVPWGLSFLPNGDALVGERNSGDVFLVSQNGGKTQVGTVAETDSSGGGEAGLLGIAVSPHFASDHWVYFYVSVSNQQHIIRKQYVGGALSGSTDTLVTGIPRGSTSNHNGGGLAFEPTGTYLFASTGDARMDNPGQGAAGSVAQDPDSLGGKTLRMNLDGTAASGNPFGNRVWTLGHRNVEGFTWDADGHMWATELGENSFDELNRIVRGRNYGWPMHEGHDGGRPKFKDPFVTWHPTSTCSPSGVAVAKGQAWVGALAGHALFSVRLTGPHAGRKVRHFHNSLGRIRTVKNAPDGSLWITTSNRDGRGNPAVHDDRVIRIVV